MNEPIEIQPEVVALVLRALETRVAANLKLAKAELSGYADGDKRTFRSPVDGQKLGSVWRTDPDAAWVIADRTALLSHLAEFPGNLVTTLEIPEENMPEALAVLNEHQPDLLREVTEVSEEAVKAALDQSAATGEPAAPGIALRKPGGVLTVRPDPNAGRAIEVMVRAGLLNWDGTKALPASDERRTA